MRIKSVSQLSNITSIPGTLPSLPISWFVDNECYIETSLSTNTHNNLPLYNSYKLSFTEYNRQILAEILHIYDYIDEQVAWLSQCIDDVSSYLSNRLDEQDAVLTSFISSANDDFVHKKRTYTYTLNGTSITQTFDVETINGDKIFIDKLSVVGANSLLSADNVIEGTARKALWG